MLLQGQLLGCLLQGIWSARALENRGTSVQATHLLGLQNSPVMQRVAPHRVRSYGHGVTNPGPSNVTLFPKIGHMPWRGVSFHTPCYHTFAALLHSFHGQKPDVQSHRLQGPAGLVKSPRLDALKKQIWPQTVDKVELICPWLTTGHTALGKLWDLRSHRSWAQSPQHTADASPMHGF